MFKGIVNTGKGNGKILHSLSELLISREIDAIRLIVLERCYFLKTHDYFFTFGKTSQLKDSKSH